MSLIAICTFCVIGCDHPLELKYPSLINYIIYHHPCLYVVENASSNVEDALLKMDVIFIRFFTAARLAVPFESIRAKAGWQ